MITTMICVKIADRVLARCVYIVSFQSNKISEYPILLSECLDPQQQISPGNLAWLPPTMKTENIN